MVRGVIALSRALGLVCIAEGMESEYQRSILDELGCDNAQGYLFARPASGADVTHAFNRLRLVHTSPPMSSTIST
jgi:EAL domain-containing protein (putative c-di-GMP-specific phosphodiesterase class I)